MKTVSEGFTILEVLISISLAMVIFLGIMQAYRNSVRFLKGASAMISTDRTACLVLNQLEKDFSSAYIPHLAKQEASGEAVHQEKRDKEPAENSKVFEKNCFVGKIDEHIDALTMHSKKYMALKLASFIATNPLEIYGEYTPRLVRIVYQLSLNKNRGEQQSFTLIRKETQSLNNTFAQEPEKPGQDPLKDIVSYVIASQIKFLSINYLYEKKEKNKQGKETIIPASSFTWGDEATKEMHGKVPRFAEIYLELWNTSMTGWQVFQITIPLFSYPTPEAKDLSTTSTKTPQKKENNATEKKGPQAKTPIINKEEPHEQ